MKEKTKVQTKLLILTIMLVALAVLPAGQAKAVLQSNPNTHYKKTDTPTNWMKTIRQIETSGNAMGLSEELDTDLTPKDGKSNGVDVHMMKSTEYGAIAILSASGYGNSQTLQSSSEKTTTGNKTGIYFSGASYEWVAGGLSGSIFSGINARYYDTYTTDRNSARAGDALGLATAANPGCKGWHAARLSDWVFNPAGTSPTKLNNYFARGGNGLFDYQYGYYYSNGTHGAPSINCSRGVAVVGSGL